jgi:sec-independent protein translocase protein TatA
MFGLGMGEILILSLIIILLFGHKKLPQVGNSIGRSIPEFKKGLQESKGEK